MRKTYIPKTYHRNKQASTRSKSRNLIIGLLKFIMLILILGGIGYLLYSPILNIIRFEAKLENEVLKDDIISRTQNLVEDQTYWWYNNQNILLLRAERLEKDLLEKFPQIKKVSIKRNLFDRVIDLDMILRTPTFYSCYDEICYNISEDGFNMGVNQALDKNLVEIKGLSTKPVGEILLSEREVRWIQNIIEEYNKIDNIKITSIDIQQKSEDSVVSVFVYTEKGYYIMLDLDTDIIYQAQVLKQVFISQLSLDQQNLLEYIDLRIKDRAYYKFK
jgi:cell division septal protein FtsQ